MTVNACICVAARRFLTSSSQGGKLLIILSFLARGKPAKGKRTLSLEAILQVMWAFMSLQHTGPLKATRASRPLRCARLSSADLILLANMGSVQHTPKSDRARIVGSDTCAKPR